MNQRGYGRSVATKEDRKTAFTKERQDKSYGLTSPGRPSLTYSHTLTTMTASKFPIDLLRADLSTIVQALNSGIITSEQLVQEYISMFTTSPYVVSTV